MRLPRFSPHILQFPAKIENPPAKSILAVGQFEVPACNLLYPSHFLTPEDMHAQHIAAQQHASAFMAIGVFTRPM
jgi:hypothetical protein